MNCVFLTVSQGQYVLLPYAAVLDFLPGLNRELKRPSFTKMTNGTMFGFQIRNGPMKTKDISGSYLLKLILYRNIIFSLLLRGLKMVVIIPLNMITIVRFPALRTNWH